MTYGVPPLYNPFGQPTPRPTLTPNPSEVTAGRKLLAFRSGASHLSADGETGYCVRYGRVYRCHWDGFNFGAWEPEGETMPEGAVKVVDGSFSNKQQVFINEYLICWNATEAARRAGYAFPNVEGPKNLVHPSIKALIQERLTEKHMSADEVLARLAAMARSNIADFAHVGSANDLQALGDSGQVIKKFKRKKYYPKDGDPYDEIEIELYPADVNLERIGRHHKLFDGGPVTFDLPPDSNFERALKSAYGKTDDSSASP